MNEVRAGLAGFELGLVTAGSRLGERHQFAFALGIHDHGLQVEEVAEIAVGVDGFDADDAAALLDRDIGREVAGFDTAQAPVGDLRPESLVVAPTDPVAAPLGLGVGRECHRPAQPVLPVGQQRVALCGQQRCLGAGFFAGRHVAE